MTVSHRQPGLETRVAIVETSRRPLGLLCDMIEGVVDMSGTSWQSLHELMPGLDYLAAGQEGESDLLVMRDPDLWLTAAQETDLQTALDRYASGAPAPAYR